MRISDWSSDVCSSDLSILRYDREMHDFSASPDHALLVLGRLDGRLCNSPAADIWLARARLKGASMLSGVAGEIGRASCRERVCQYVSISVVAVSSKKQRY